MDWLLHGGVFATLWKNIKYLSYALGGGGGVGEMDRLGIDKAIMLLVSYRQPVPDPYIEA